MFFLVTWPIRRGFLKRHPVLNMLGTGFVVVVALALIQAAMSGPVAPPKPESVYYPNPVWTPPPPPSVTDHPDVPLTSGAYWYTPDYGHPGAGVVWLWVPPTLGPSDLDFCPDVSFADSQQITMAQSEAYDQFCADYTPPTLLPTPSP